MTIRKMKAKIRRKARALERKKEEKQESAEKAMKKLISSFDNKFYDLFGDNSYSWICWYFPVITAHEGLQEIDACMQQYLRFFCNYRIRYQDLKKLGYTPLVHEYYVWKEENRMLEEQYRKQKEQEAEQK